VSRPVQWNLRMRAAERGIWKSAQMRRMLADSGLEISAGKMSSWWAGSPPTVRLDELDVLCAALQCTPSDLLTPEPGKVAARRPEKVETVNGDDVPPRVTPRFGTPRSEPPL
jgi:putative transcriptional regulator